MCASQQMLEVRYATLPLLTAFIQPCTTVKLYGIVAGGSIHLQFCTIDRFEHPEKLSSCSFTIRKLNKQKVCIIFFYGIAFPTM